MDRNLSQALKRKRDAEKRLELTSSSPVFVGTGGGTYITNEQIVQTITNINTLLTQKDLLTNGDPVNPSLIFSPRGDVIWVEV